MVSRRGNIAFLVLVVATVVSGGLGHPADATFDGSNGRIAYRLSWYASGNSHSAIFTVRPDGTGERRLTFSRHASKPIWGPFGQRIAYERAGAVWVMRADGSGKARLIRGRLVGWMPKGGRILVVRGEYPDSSATRWDDPVWMLFRISTGEVEKLPIDLPLVGGLQPPYEDYDEWSYMMQPTLAPDGDRVAFTLRRTDFESDGYDYLFGSLFIVGLDGTDLGRVGSLYSPTLWNPEWAPSGRQLAYEWSIPRGDCPNTGDRSGDGLSSIRLAGTRGSVDVSQYCGESAPAWSPDGRQIAFTTPRALRISNRDGSGVTTVLRGGDRFIEQPDWRRLPPPR